MNTASLVALVSIVVAGLTMALGAIGAAISEARIGAAAMDAFARQPDEGPTITRALFVCLAMVESTAIFCLVVTLILLFANPFSTPATQEGPPSGAAVSTVTEQPDTPPATP